MSKNAALATRVLQNEHECKLAALQICRSTIKGWASEANGVKPLPRYFCEFAELCVSGAVSQIHLRSESPIEKVFFSSVELKFCAVVPTGLIWSPNFPPTGPFLPDVYGRFPFLRDVHHLCLQPEILVDGKTMRPDGLIWIPSKLPERRLLIECDGYAFHSSPEKFTADRKRDRALKALGYEVFRFSGSEIMSDPIAAANLFCESLPFSDLELERVH